MLTMFNEFTSPFQTARTFGSFGGQRLTHVLSKLFIYVEAAHTLTNTETHCVRSIP